MPVSIVRSVRFRAAHRYWRCDWSEAENHRIFGQYTRLHEHDWVLEVTASGETDPATGFVLDLGALDALLEEVVGPLRESDLEEAIAEVREGGMIPSTENLARWAFERLAGRMPGTSRLVKVRVSESDGLAAEFSAP